MWLRRRSRTRHRRGTAGEARERVAETARGHEIHEPDGARISHIVVDDHERTIGRDGIGDEDGVVVGRSGARVGDLDGVDRSRSRNGDGVDGAVERVVESRDRLHHEQVGDGLVVGEVDVVDRDVLVAGIPRSARRAAIDEGELRDSGLIEGECDVAVGRGRAWDIGDAGDGVDPVEADEGRVEHGHARGIEDARAVGRRHLNLVDERIEEDRPHVHIEDRERHVRHAAGMGEVDRQHDLVRTRWVVHAYAEGVLRGHKPPGFGLGHLRSRLDQRAGASGPAHIHVAGPDHIALRESPVRRPGLGVPIELGRHGRSLDTGERQQQEQHRSKPGACVTPWSHLLAVGIGSGGRALERVAPPEKAL